MAVQIQLAESSYPARSRNDGSPIFILRVGFILLLLICAAAPALAGRVFFEQLEEMIGRVDVIVIGTIISADRPKTESVGAVKYIVAVSENLAGEPVTHKLEFSYHCCPSTGAGEFRFSPIVTGWSGIEGNLENGAEYLFLLDIGDIGSGATAAVIRVEPLAKRELLIAMWQAQRQEHD